MEKANCTLIRAEMLDGEVQGVTVRGARDEIMALLAGMVAMYLGDNPADRKIMRDVLRMAFRDTRPRLGDVLRAKLGRFAEAGRED